MTQTHQRGGVWACKIGETDGANVPDGGDLPMRTAIAQAYRRVTGEEPAFILSGWSAKLTESERAVVNNELPRQRQDALNDQLRDVIMAAVDMGCWDAADWIKGRI